MRTSDKFEVEVVLAVGLSEQVGFEAYKVESR